MINGNTEEPQEVTLHDRVSRINSICDNILAKLFPPAPEVAEASQDRPAIESLSGRLDSIKDKLEAIASQVDKI